MNQLRHYIRLSELSQNYPRYAGFLYSCLSLMRPRTWVIAASTFFFAYSLSGNLIPWKAALGIIICMMTTGSANLMNAYTDKVEDATNQPSRALLLETMGLGKVRKVLFLLYSLIFALSTFLGFFFFIVTFLAVLDSIFYSLPPFRFKSNVISGMVAFTGVVALSFIAGWILSNPISDIHPLFYVVSYFFFTYSAFKNIPDYIGDRKANLRTLMTVAHNYKQGVIMSYILLISSYFLLTIFMALQLLSTKYIFMLLLLPVLVYNGYLTAKARSTAEMEKLHSYGFLYGVTFLMMIFFISVPTIESFVAITFFYTLILLAKTMRLDSR